MMISFIYYVTLLSNKAKTFEKKIKHYFEASGKEHANKLHLFSLRENVIVLYISPLFSKQN